MNHPYLTAILGLLVIGGIAAWFLVQNLAKRRFKELEFLRSREISRYHAMGPAQFERALAILCERDGCGDAEAIGRSGDLGADVTATAPDGRRIVIQAKRYSKTTKVTGPDLQRFGGTCFSIHQAEVAVVVTTSTFTKQAREYAAKMDIQLFDHEGLAAWASQTGPPPWDLDSVSITDLRVGKSQ